MSATPPPLSLPECRDLVTAVLELRRLASAAVPPGVYRCVVCGGVGPWPSEIRHGPMPGDGPRARPCRVARALAVLPVLVDHLRACERHGADTPIVDQENA